jgi:hypothetical protein
MLRINKVDKYKYKYKYVEDAYDSATKLILLPLFRTHFISNILRNRQGDQDPILPNTIFPISRIFVRISYK